MHPLQMLIHPAGICKISETNMFENELLPATAVQQRQCVDAVGCRTFSSALISMFVSHILQILAGCIQICSGFNASTTTGMFLVAWFDSHVTLSPTWDVSGDMV